MKSRMRKCPSCLVRFNGNVNYCVTCMSKLRNNPFTSTKIEREHLMRRYYDENKARIVSQQKHLKHLKRQGDVFVQKENPKCIVKFNEDGSLKE